MARKIEDSHNKLTPESKDWVESQAKREEQTMALAEIRKARKMTQTQLANTLNIKQPSVADMEKRTDMYVSTLRSLIEGMGGKLEIIARFPEGNVHIKNFSGI